MANRAPDREKGGCIVGTSEEAGKPAVGVSGACNGLGKWRKGGEEEELGWCGNSR